MASSLRTLHSNPSLLLEALEVYYRNVNQGLEPGKHTVIDYVSAIQINKCMHKCIKKCAMLSLIDMNAEPGSVLTLQINRKLQVDLFVFIGFICIHIF